MEKKYKIGYIYSKDGLKVVLWEDYKPIALGTVDVLNFLETIEFLNYDYDLTVGFYREKCSPYFIFNNLELIEERKYV